jgi:hypothetical protein
MSDGSGWETVPPLPRARDRMPGVIRHPRLWPWLILLVVSSGVTAAIGWQIVPAAIDLPSLRSRPLSQQSAPRAVAVEQRLVRLFFPQETGETLKELERKIPHRPVLAEAVRAVIRELANGVPGGRSPIPPATEVRQVFLDAFGILYLDCSQEIQAIALAPGADPELAISAIVNSLTASFSEVKRVQFLVEGKELAGIAGSWDLRRPISPRFPGEENPSVVSPPQG